ncbi:hypothetical protein [Micromonospora sp. CNB394]|uniref:hypothetical protein n=1 Tax=Micromonospora sp. CNB394 TaxID=1169151 RepID=UPI0003652EC1|nr:hypothetical protein [Micromonospora sp. CNB394]
MADQADADGGVVADRVAQPVRRPFPGAHRAGAVLVDQAPLGRLVPGALPADLLHRDAVKERAVGQLPLGAAFASPM